MKPVYSVWKVVEPKIQCRGILGRRNSLGDARRSARIGLHHPNHCYKANDFRERSARILCEVDSGKLSRCLDSRNHRAHRHQPCPHRNKSGIQERRYRGSARAVPEYVALALTKLVPTMEAWATGGTFAEISKSKFCELQIPLPPLEVQKEIVAEIEGYQKVINGARAVLDNYRPHIPIHPDWPMVALDDLCNIEHGFAFKGEFFVQEKANDLPILLTPGNFVQGGGLYFTEKNTKKYSGDFPDSYRLQRGDLVVVMTDLSPMMKILGMPAIIDSDHFLHNQRIGKIVLKSDQVLKSFLRYAFLLDVVNGRIKREATGSTVRHTSPSRILRNEHEIT